MNSKGFTLIEIIIVIVIVAVMSAVVVLNVGAPNFSRFRGDVEKFSSTLAVLSDEAIYSGDVIACNLTVNSISCSRYRDGEWTEMNPRQYIAWSWPKNLVIQSVFINGVPLKDNESIKFLPSGDNPSLSIQLGNGEYTAWIDSDLIGRYKVSI